MNEKRIQVWRVALLVLALVFCAPYAVADIPPLPSDYQGTVIVDGSAAPAGTVIYAIVGDYQSDNVTAINGNYDSLVVAPTNSSAVGQTVYFYVIPPSAQPRVAGTTTFAQGQTNVVLALNYTTQNTAPTAPNTPSPSNGATGVSITPTLSWSGGDFDLNDTVTYSVYFEASDATPDVLVSTNQTATTYAPGTLSYSATYYWQIVSSDGNATTNGSVWSFTTAAQPSGGGSTPPPATNAPPATPAAPSGPTSGLVNTTYSYTVSATDANGDQVQYMVDWGDGTTSAWTALGASGHTATLSHSWTQAGTYAVKAKARDVNNTESAGWSAARSVTIASSQTQASNTSLDQANQYAGINITAPFYANDTDGDGVADTFDDPNGVLTAVQSLNISSNATFLISADNDTIPEFFWDVVADKIVPITYNLGVTSPPVVNTGTKEITVTVEVEKADWIYIEVADDFPGFAVTIVTDDNRTISPDMVWRENGKIYVLDDPVQVYNVVYNASTDTTAPSVSILVPSEGATLDGEIIATIIASDDVGVTSIEVYIDDTLHTTLYNTPYSAVINTTAYTDGTHTLTARAYDALGNTAEDTVGITIQNEAPPAESDEVVITTEMLIFILIGSTAIAGAAVYLLVIRRGDDGKK